MIVANAHQPKPIIATNDYSDTIRQALAGKTASKPQPEAEPPGQTRAVLARLYHGLDSIGNRTLLRFIGTAIAILFVSLMLVMIVSAFTPKPTTAAADPAVIHGLEMRNVVYVSPTIQPVTAASINAQMKPDSQTVVVSVEPPPLPAAAIAQQIIITQGLIAGGVAGWFNDNVAGNQTFTCPDSLCGVYNPNTKLFICGGWLGIDGNKMSANFEVIKPVHTCTVSTRVASDSRAALIYLSQSTRSALIGNTDQWPLLVVEVYADRAPYPVMTEGK